MSSPRLIELSDRTTVRGFNVFERVRDSIVEPIARALLISTRSPLFGKNPRSRIQGNLKSVRDRFLEDTIIGF
ncbi:hypothetical protein IQ249_25240 [Lusitaniella coriacea LEGE 07157]|uniref:Uncharacterized protein n=1 Tax=Lusitaniella coriacea LEGE 07157 TaxID=945747 RepID=A0A8J7E2D0_9CYAN|nr:hypothetical protein [Lusitaniella coriacea]MBE9119163.1 hypothetical protein [Lusitaniella coriacea LEGE 07157]